MTGGMHEQAVQTAPAAEAPGELSSHDRILLAGRHLFAADGYENTTTSAIARAAGTSESQLIKHFGSKEGLLEAIFEDAWLRLGERMGLALEQAPTPLAKLGSLSELIFSALERDADLRTLMLLEGRRIRRRGQVVGLSRGFLRVVQLIDGLFEEMRQRGELRPGLDPQAARSVLVGAFEGLLRDQLLAERVDYPAAYGPREVRVAFGAVLDGFMARDGQPAR
jgi:AcrR family transcriptional regulator